jgi:4-diphosphocytidyl-2-C-methyl-D-erythritol kinase
VAAQAGSDVPFFLHGGTALAEGRGERITRLPPAPAGWAVLLVPPITVENKTRTLFSLLGPRHFTGGEAARAWVAALAAGRTWGEMPAAVNTFEMVADGAFPGLAMYRQAFHNTGAEGVRLSGAGPTLYGILSNEEDARRTGEALQGTGALVHVARLAG